MPPLVGRASEVARLLERWQQRRAGLGQVVLLRGEGGIGKSRLTEVLRQWVVSEGSPGIVLRCSPYHTNSALYPVIEHLQRVLQFTRDDSPEEKLRNLEEALMHTPLPPSSLSLRERVRVRGDSSQFSTPNSLTPALSQGERENRREVVPLLVDLLSVPLPDGCYPPVLLSAQQQQWTLDALVAWLLVEAERQPVLAVWGDLHAAQVQAMVGDGRITVESPLVLDASVLDGYRPGQGEKESFILALAQADTDYLVVDDRLAFIVSDRMTVPKTLLVDLLVELVWQGFIARQLVEQMLQVIAPRYAPGFIPHTLKMLERGERRCLT